MLRTRAALDRLLLHSRSFLPIDGSSQLPWQAPALQSIVSRVAFVRHKYHNRIRPHLMQLGVRKSYRLYELKMGLEESDDEDEFLNYLQKEVTSTYIERWRRRMSLLLQSSKNEIMSMESKDLKCYNAISYIAKELGLYINLYWKTIVVSKLPLPLYRPDLDPDRPQRQVYVAPATFFRVKAFLDEYKRHRKEKEAKVELFPIVATEQPPQSLPDVYDPLAGIFGDAKKSKLMFDRQRAWQDSREGQIALGFRSKLPAFQLRSAFLESLSRCQVLVVTGGTGCGKTTQLPQYILESEIDGGCGSSCKIVCTQPRRISASSVALRVAEERGEVLGESVGYQVRFDSVRSRSTSLLFCTTGILLRRLMSDPVLNGVTHVIVDEIHERGLNEDFLLIVLRDVIQRRPDLKLILMSATVDAKLFEKYFLDLNTRCMDIPGFAYTVKSYYLEDVLNITGYKLSMQSRMWKYLRQAPEASDLRAHISEENIVREALNAEDYSNAGEESIDFTLIEKLLCHICEHGQEGAVLVFMTGWEDISALRRQLRTHPVLGHPSRVWLLACHGTMSPDEQKRIFDRPPSRVRKIILATNIAETSITVEDVVYVVDIGKAKEKSYDVATNTACLLPRWISKSSVRQRKGRAGRLKPGVCYHLYPESVFQAFEDHNEPEILRTALHNVCLRIKGLQLGDIQTFLAKAIEPPNRHAVHIAIEFLKVIGALDETEELTVLGKHLAILPVEPQIGKMLIMGCIFQCLDPMLTIAAALSSRDPFILPVDKREDSNQAKFKFSIGEMSDHLAVVRAFNDWEVCMKHNTASEFCRANFLSMQVLIGMTSMRKQFLSLLQEAGYLDGGLASCEAYSSDPMIVRAVICAGLFPGVAAVVATPGSVTHKTMDGTVVHVHPHSVNARHEESCFPWLVFLEKIKTSNVFIRDSTGISDSVLLLFGGALVSIGQPGHLQMCGKCLEFFMGESEAELFQEMRDLLDELLKLKLARPDLDIYKHRDGLLMRAVMLMIRGDALAGKFMYGKRTDVGTFDGLIGDKDSKVALRVALLREGLTRRPSVSTKLNRAKQHVSTIQFRGLKFIGEPDRLKRQAERNACAEAVAWLANPDNAEKKKLLMWGGGKLTKVRLGDCMGQLKKLLGKLPPEDEERLRSFEDPKSKKQRSNALVPIDEKKNSKIRKSRKANEEIVTQRAKRRANFQKLVEKSETPVFGGCSLPPRPG
ncbi:DExH-box ATP-dependent RNA helicase DExH5, mitochondrial-like [Selaginella moellendorffii]|uniref:DExH-box ATP-dependent RNA helicase DExH5, mitochondrial-like n=1 Tax=Selaginella moellendorffii TaxID=88036 RepID=UPI000D1CCF0A|nr:DExH-box ATP-dependent RNA helicase DExH5, mitochondrial-like [Selaginella moellendorffii]|eukprot:XP_024542281.1 DExH-box ATP-dependent RNA helicase DExH5, mitochondrial-like [Selaginella moellendorffii]